MPRTISLLISWAICAFPADARDFFIDPAAGSPSGDGSRERPWRALEEVAAAGLFPEPRYGEDRTTAEESTIQAGDTLYLLDGYHGTLALRGIRNERAITIAAAPGHRPRLRNVSLRGVRNWILRGLSVSGSHAPEYTKTTLIAIGSDGAFGGSSDVSIAACDVFSVDDSSAWTAADWVAKAANGISIDGDRCRVSECSIRNTRFALIASGPRAFVSRNRIKNFSGDAIRGLGDYSTYEYNTIESALKVDKNHDDGFQSWSRGPGGAGTGVVRGVTLRGNTFIHSRDPKQPLVGPFQGIGCFDGMFEDWVIENNVVAVNHWNGIALLGARNCRVTHNTVIDMFEQRPGPSWIRVSDHKNGTKAVGNVVANNLAHSYKIDNDSGVSASNLSVAKPERFFIDPDRFDFRLSPRSPAINAGDERYGTAQDASGQARDDQPDVGAYEFTPPP